MKFIALFWGLCFGMSNSYSFLGSVQDVEVCGGGVGTCTIFDVNRSMLFDGNTRAYSLWTS